MQRCFSSAVFSNRVWNPTRRLQTCLLVMLVALWGAATPAAFAQVTLWQTRTAQPNGGADVVTGMVVDPAGNMIVTGYSNNGTSDDYVTIKYSAIGLQQWVQRYDGFGLTDRALSVAVDPAGNAFVTGLVSPTPSDQDIVTIKYSASGAQQWVRTYTGPANGFDIGNAITVDAGGNAIVAGQSVGIGTSADLIVQKYNTNGDLQWTRIYNGPANAFDTARAVAVDSAGNIYAAGGSVDNTTAQDFLTVKYAADGTLLWARTHNGPDNLDDGATAIALDAAGNAYATGFSSHGVNDNDALTIKYAADGTQQWFQRFSGADNKNDIGYAIAVDGAGNVLIAGTSLLNASGANTLAIKYGPNGTQQWIQTYNGPGNGDDEARSIAVDAAGNAYIVGYSTGTTTSRDYITIKYSPAGAQQWLQRFNGIGNGSDFAGAVRLDSKGNVCVAGYSTASPNDTDIVALKYGQFAWNVAGQSIGSDRTHLLWKRVDNAASLWNIPSAAVWPNLTREFGPFPGWTPALIATGPSDNKARLVWTNDNGGISLWRVGTDFSIEGTWEFGPFAGWSVVSLAVDPNNITRLMWKHIDGRISIWAIDANGNIMNTVEFGPYAGWSANAIGVNRDGATRVLWNNNSGQVSLWRIDPSGAIGSIEFGPFTGWSASGIAANGGDGNTRLLWRNDDGRVSVWTVSGQGAVSAKEYGGFGNWDGRAISVSPTTSKPYLLWTRGDGLQSLWRLNPSATLLEQSLEFGPF